MSHINHDWDVILNEGDQSQNTVQVGFPKDLRTSTFLTKFQKRHKKLAKGKEITPFNIAKAKEDFGYEPTVRIWEGLEKTVEWWGIKDE